MGGIPHQGKTHWFQTCQQMFIYISKYKIKLTRELAQGSQYEFLD